MVNHRLYWWLESNKIIDDSQAGFRKGCRTEDHLLHFVQKTLDAFQKGKHTTAVFIDLQQAYDTVWRQGLFAKMTKMGIHGKMYCWIKAFLNNRTIQTTIDGTKSSKLTLEEGLPQGSALSCTLFLIFINDLPPNLNVPKLLYADDLLIWTAEKYKKLAQAKLNRNLATIAAYCRFWKLKINTQKTVYTIFTKSFKENKKAYQLKLDGEMLCKDKIPTYLGVELDRQLFLNPFMNKVKDKASRRLNLVKHLASTKWGAEKGNLRQLYLGYVRSVMDYNLPLQSAMSNTAQGKLDKVQNQALRFICGGMRTTPTAACEIDADIEPMDLRRKRSVLEATERYRRMRQGHPNRSLVENWKPINKIKQNSPLQVAANTAGQHYLPQTRESTEKYPNLYPARELTTPEIRTTLIDNKLTRDTITTILKTATLETIDSYPHTAIHAYTDGSACRAALNAGLGAIIKYPNGDKLEIHEPCGKFCNNYQAEIAAINTTLSTITKQFKQNAYEPSNIVIFTDSKSTLQALEDYLQTDNKEIILLAETIDTLQTSFNIKLTLQWIPGHVGIPGNEKADRLAKQGAAMEQINTPTNNHTVKQILKNNSKDEWLKRWAKGSTGRSMYKEMKQPDKNDCINKLPRKEQCTIFRLRTEHTTLNKHLNRLKLAQEPKCRNCTHPFETVQHVLLECPALISERKQLLPDRPTITNILYSSTQQLHNTCRFIGLALAVEEQLARQH